MNFKLQEHEFCNLITWNTANSRSIASETALCKIQSARLVNFDFQYFHKLTISHIDEQRIMSRMNGSCHIWIGHVTYELVVSQWMDHVTYEWVNKTYRNIVLQSICQKWIGGGFDHAQELTDTTKERKKRIWCVQVEAASEGFGSARLKSNLT